MLHNKTCPVNLSVKSFNSDAAKCEKCFHLQHLHTTPGTAERKRDGTVKTKQISQSTNRDGRRRTSNHNDSVRSCKRSVSWTHRDIKCVSLSLRFSSHELSLQHTHVQVGEWGSAQVGRGCKTLPQFAWRQVGRALALLWRWFIPSEALLNSMPLYW